MIVVDTNVWARAFLADHVGQSSRARQALAHARSKEGVFVPLVVVADLSWVLRAAGWDRERVLRTLESLLRTRGVTPEAPELVQAAVDVDLHGVNAPDAVLLDCEPGKRPRRSGPRAAGRARPGA